MKDGQEPHLHSIEGGGATDEELRKREREDVTRPIEPGELEEADRFVEDSSRLTDVTADTTLSDSEGYGNLPPAAPPEAGSGTDEWYVADRPYAVIDREQARAEATSSDKLRKAEANLDAIAATRESFNMPAYTENAQKIRAEADIIGEKADESERETGRKYNIMHNPERPATEDEIKQIMLDNLDAALDAKVADDLWYAGTHSGGNRADKRWARDLRERTEELARTGAVARKILKAEDLTDEESNEYGMVKVLTEAILQFAMDYHASPTKDEELTITHAVKFGRLSRKNDITEGMVPKEGASDLVQMLCGTLGEREDFEHIASRAWGGHYEVGFPLLTDLGFILVLTKYGGVYEPSGAKSSYTIRLMGENNPKFRGWVKRNVDYLKNKDRNREQEAA